MSVNSKNYVRNEYKLKKKKKLFFLIGKTKPFIDIDMLFSQLRGSLIYVAVQLGRL